MQRRSISEPLIHGSFDFIWRVQNNRRKEHQMKNHIGLIAACALIAAAIFASAPNGHFSSLANTAPAPEMSPTEMMINYGSPLPVEQWDAS
jgi:hypothetical protein